MFFKNPRGKKSWNPTPTKEASVIWAGSPIFVASKGEMTQSSLDNTILFKQQVFLTKYLEEQGFDLDKATEEDFEIASAVCSADLDLIATKTTSEYIEHFTDKHASKTVFPI